MKALAMLLAGALMVVVSGCVSARPAPETPSEKPTERGEGDLMVVTGVVRTVGAEPFSAVVITDDDDVDWYVLPEDVEKLQLLEQQLVQVRGILNFRRMTLADGRELPPRRELFDLEVLEVIK